MASAAAKAKGATATEATSASAREFPLSDRLLANVPERKAQK